MTLFFSALVGLILLAAVGWIIWILVRGVCDRRLPIGKGEVRRDERAAAFRSLSLSTSPRRAMGLIELTWLTGFTRRGT